MEKLINVDEKDRKILAELDKNSQQTDSEISKRVGLSKQVTNYRIKNLEKKGIISNFYTVVNVGKLGFSSYYLFIQFQNVSEKEEKELMVKIKSKDYVGWLVSGTGRWDAVVLIYSDSALKFNANLNDLLSICEGKVHDYIFTSLISAEHLGYKFLGEKNFKKAIQTEKKDANSLDKTDKKILKSISQNARFSTVGLSEKIKVPLHTVRYRMKELIKKEIIESFKPKIEINRLGYQWHLLLIQYAVVNENRKKEFLNFCEQHKSIYYLTETIGNYNLMLDIHVKSTEEFKKVLSELKEKFPDVIKLYELIVIFEEFKIDYFTNLFDSEE